MNLAALPDTSALPAPVWLLTALHVLTLTLHFAAMNFLFGGLVVLTAGRLPGGWEHPVSRRFARLFPLAMAATVTLGVAPLLFAQLVYGRQLYGAAIVSGWFWLLVPFIAIAVYYLLYASSFRVGTGRSVGSLLGLALLGLVAISLVYSTVFSLGERPAEIARLYAADPSGMQIHGDVSAWGLRWLHMLAGAVTVGGFFVGLLGRDDEGAHRLGRRVFLWGTVVSAALGTAYLATLGDALRPLMRSAGAYGLALGVVCGALAVWLFARRRFVAAAASLFAALLGMVAVRHALRRVRLEATYRPEDLPIEPQWAVFALFLACFVGALALVGWMIRAWFSVREPAAP